MYVKKFRRKCSVKGCKNVDNVYIISQRRDMGNSVAICTDCLKEAQTSVDGYVEEVKVVREPKPLFPHPEVKTEVTLSSVADIEPEPQEVIEEVKEDIPTVTEDTVTHIEKPIAETKAPAKPKTTAKTSGKKKTKKK
jgi:hypothetical protein